MSDASLTPPSDVSNPLGEKLTREEIYRRYPDQWVALVDYDFPNMQVTAGIVYAHHPDRAVIRQMTYHLLNAAILWTGKRSVFLPPWCFRVAR
jgi:hypothetical protein